jgi:hypothetical protein
MVQYNTYNKRKILKYSGCNYTAIIWQNVASTVNWIRVVHLKTAFDSKQGKNFEVNSRVLGDSDPLEV